MASIWRCLRFARVVPRTLWSGNLQTLVFVPGGRGLESSLRAVRPEHNKLQLRRGFSSDPSNNNVTYEELKQLLAKGKAVVIDVREPWELREFGFIPGSINVPMAQVNSALQLCPEEFKEKYGGEMPEQTDIVVFTCLAGIRSKSAVNAAASLGYKEVQHYSGGWKDWEKNERII
ncbi:thiosulfate sulfurtransferase/rhodanese-like domain-containing protein 3 [Cynoglossus semilaevis]|uniref:Thiosulfate sulfurtransferase like domain containing 3 n=1 Tax=Cynoglossus semilaevis TaxID=244447 RepID=A0A3P8VGQ0_CYNSE|nr:thiosulfate sulfurtransferase/rhodanese-like domain-containing protein 3 [Cynoglossus semilaevis]